MNGVVIIATREIKERLRHRGFQASALIALLLVVGAVVLPTFHDDQPHYDIASSVGSTPALPTDSSPIKLRVIDSDTDVLRLVRQGNADGGLLRSGAIALPRDPDPTLTRTLTDLAIRQHMTDRLSARGLTAAEQDVLFDFQPRIHYADDDGPRTLASQGDIATMALFLLFGQLMTYGFWISASVIEEKASRIVELVLAAVRPRRLLAGKLLGMGVLALGHTLLLATGAIIAANAVETLDVTPPLLGALGVVLAGFLVGFALYASLFAVTAALVSRQEDVGNATTPVQLLLVGSLLASVQATADPGSTLSNVTAYFPSTAPLVMTSRLIGGQAEWWQVATAVATCGITIAVLIPLAGRLYGALLLGRRRRTRLLDLIRERAWAPEFF